MAYVPTIKHSCGQLVLKGEDYLVVSSGTLPSSAITKNPILRESLDSAQEAEADVLPRDSASPHTRSPTSTDTADRSYSIYCVFDGHNGKDAAKHAKNSLKPTLHDRLPAGPVPRPGSKCWQAWCQALQSTMVGVFAELHESYACIGLPAGCTATAVLQTGQLLTIANLGDSRACLDTGAKVHQLTVDHRVATHKGERRRLQDRSVHIAPIGLDGEGPAQGEEAEGYGPLRMWPGGLCLSRAIGDFDVGENVLCAPHIQQVLMPDSGCRVMVGSDGVWDAFDTNGRVARMTRSTPTERAPDKVLRTIKSAHTGIKDDATLIVVDFMPAGTSFAQLCQAKPGLAKSAGGSLRGRSCFCMSSSATTDDEPSAPKVKPPGNAELLTDMDVAACAGLVTDPTAVVPPWLDSSWVQDIREIQAAAVEAWQAAAARKGMGQVMSRDDLAGYFTRAHSKAIPETRTQHPVDPADYTVKFGTNSLEAAAPKPKGDASMHYRAAVASEDSFGQKFGHYAHEQITDGGSSAENTNQSQHFAVNADSPSKPVQPEAAPAPSSQAPEASKPQDTKDAKRAGKGRRVHILEAQQ